MTTPVSSSPPRAPPSDRARRPRGAFGDALRAARSRAAPSPAKPLRPQPRAAGRRPTDGMARDPSPEVMARAAGEADRRSSDAQAAAAVGSLRAAVRALPAAVEAARLASGAEVALSFGPAVGVELRQGAAGLEVTLRASAALGRAAAAELPGLVAALRDRGLAVTRAEVRTRSEGGPGGGAASGRAR